MTQLGGISSASAVNSTPSNQPQKILTLEVPTTKPTRQQIADAVFRHFGFTRDDTLFLKRHFQNVDPFAYFARTLEYDPRSTYTEHGTVRTRVQLSAADYEVMRNLAQQHHPPDEPRATPVNSRDAAAAKLIYDPNALLRDRLLKQTEPRAPSTTGAPANGDAPSQQSAEGIKSVIEGALVGDFSDNESWSKTGGQILGGVIPVYGQLADARDTVAALRDVRDGKAGSGVLLAAAIIGWVPVVGDSVKAALRAGRKVLKESAEEVAERAVKEQAETLSRIVDPEARAAAERAVRSEATTKYAARELDVAQQMDDLAVQGHGPQRHGSQITEQQLDNRAMYSIDPVTGTTDDAYLKMTDGTPRDHRPAKNATKVMTDEAYVEAEKQIRNSQAFRDAIAKATADGKPRAPVEDVRLEDIFGADYQQHVFGKTRIGSKTNPIGTSQTDFTEGTMKAVYRKNDKGEWVLHSMYPEPKQ